MNHGKTIHAIKNISSNFDHQVKKMALVERIGNTRFYLITHLFDVHSIYIYPGFKKRYSMFISYTKSFFDKLKKRDVLCSYSVPEQSV